MTRTAATVATIVLVIAGCGGAVARDLEKGADKQNWPMPESKTAAPVPFFVQGVHMQNLLLPAIQKVRDAAARP